MTSTDNVHDANLAIPFGLRGLSGQIMVQPVPLSGAIWRNRIAYLREQCPGWEFVPAFYSD